MARKMWIQVSVLEGPGNKGRDYSDETQAYDLFPVSHELKGRLTLDVKPQFLNSAIARIGVDGRPSPTPSTGSRGDTPLYEPVKEGDIKEDVDDMMESLTGKGTSPFVTLVGELIDDMLRPGRNKGDRR